MTQAELDPLIHAPARLRIVVTLAALGDGDTVTFTRLQDLTGLTAGNLITHLRKLEGADYLSSAKVDTASGIQTTVALTNDGRAALAAYRRTLRELLGES